MPKIVAKAQDLVAGHHAQPLLQGYARADRRDDLDPVHVQVDVGKGLGQHARLAQIGKARVRQVKSRPGKGLEQRHHRSSAAALHGVVVARTHAHVELDGQIDLARGAAGLESQIVFE